MVVVKLEIMHGYKGCDSLLNSVQLHQSHLMTALKELETFHLALTVTLKGIADKHLSGFVGNIGQVQNG